MFEVTYGTNLHEYKTRKEAIVAAKEISGEYRGMVNIADENGRERMVYQSGELVSYDYETRLRRRAPNERPLPDTTVATPAPTSPEAASADAN